MTWTAADMAAVDADPANRRTRDPMRHAVPAVKSPGRVVTPPTADELAAHVARFQREVPLERARLAAVDPEGEAEAVALLGQVRARQALLLAADAAAMASRRRIPISGNGHYLESGRDLLTRLGADPGRAHGVMRCPAHEDRSPSLSWRLVPDGRALVHCYAGCTFTAILEAVA